MSYAETKKKNNNGMYTQFCSILCFLQFISETRLLSLKEEKWAQLSNKLRAYDTEGRKDIETVHCSVTAYCTSKPHDTGQFRTLHNSNLTVNQCPRWYDFMSFLI
jgi:hypothetical protein